MRTPLCIFLIILLVGCRKEKDQSDQFSRYENVKLPYLDIDSLRSVDYYNWHGTKGHEDFIKAEMLASKGAESKKIISAYNKALNKGHMLASATLARHYYFGKICDEDDTLSVQLAERAMKAGLAQGYHQMAKCLASGRGVPKDEQKAYDFIYIAELLGEEDLWYKKYSPKGRIRPEALSEFKIALKNRRNLVSHVRPQGIEYSVWSIFIKSPHSGGIDEYEIVVFSPPNKYPRIDGPGSLVRASDYSEFSEDRIVFPFRGLKKFPIELNRVDEYTFEGEWTCHGDKWPAKAYFLGYVPVLYRL